MNKIAPNKGISEGVFIFLPFRITAEGGIIMPRKKKTIKEKVEAGLTKLAFGDVSDAVSLLFLSDEEALSKLPKLNLFNVSEIKKPRGGGMEIKFYDRIKACERLREDAADGSDEGLSFYQALEKSAENAESVFKND